jgi:hypothetical protein
MDVCHLVLLQSIGLLVELAHYAVKSVLLVQKTMALSWS